MASGSRKLRKGTDSGQSRSAPKKQGPRTSPKGAKDEDLSERREKWVRDNSREETQKKKDERWYFMRKLPKTKKGGSLGPLQGGTKGGPKRP